jgi:hypothetical protein
MLLHIRQNIMLACGRAISSFAHSDHRLVPLAASMRSEMCAPPSTPSATTLSTPGGTGDTIPSFIRESVGMGRVVNPESQFGAFTYQVPLTPPPSHWRIPNTL